MDTVTVKGFNQAVEQSGVVMDLCCLVCPHYISHHNDTHAHNPRMRAEEDEVNTNTTQRKAVCSIFRGGTDQRGHVSPVHLAHGDLLLG